MKSSVQNALKPWKLPARSLAIYSVRAEATKALDVALSKAMSLGFTELEMRAVTPAIARDQRALLDNYSLLCSSIVASPDIPPMQQVEAAVILGAKYLAIPALPVYFTLEKGKFQWRKKIDTSSFAGMTRLLTEMAHGCISGGIRLAYHMHDNDFYPLEDGFSPFDRILREVDSKILDFELDLGHLHAARPDIPGILQRLRGRVPLVHLKDYVPTLLNEPKGAAMVALGEGIIDFETLLPSLHAIGAKHYFIEMEYSTDQWAGVERSAKWLMAKNLF